MKAAICGAGIAGIALAHRLTTLDWDVVVLEQAPGPRTQGYMLDFFRPGYDAAEAMGSSPGCTSSVTGSREWITGTVMGDAARI
jgi:2-polyprenyl-6-methoxyphenol hydroxylase-like FAD-dependent oxidoreductase